MKKCPNCGELLGDSVDECMFCNYSFKLNKVISQETIRAQQEARRKEIEEYNQKRSEQLRQEQQKKVEEEQRYRREREERDLRWQEEKVRLSVQNQKLITTGYNFEGYRIVSYYGVMSGSVVVGTGMFSELAAGISDMFGAKSKEFSDKLEYARSAAMKRLVERSESVGGNAIIGVDFDYMTFANNMIGVVASGTSVFVEKIEE